MKRKATKPYRMRIGRNGAESNEPNTNPTPIDDKEAIGINNLGRNKHLGTNPTKSQIDQKWKMG